MKKSKILIFAALVAAATISVGCSNDDVVTTKDSGVPLKVTANAGDASRAQQITGSSFKYFQLYGFLGDTNNEFKNKTFTGTNQQSDWTATDDLFASNWPAENTDYTFYGVSENSASGMSTAFTNATFSNTAQTFTYTIPSDIAAQKDLLVAKASGNSSSGLTMNFEHALALATLKVKIDPSITPYAEEMYRLRVAIKSVTFHNVNTGIYNFSPGENEPNWTLAEGNEDPVYGTMTYTFAEEQIIDTDGLTAKEMTLSLGGENGKIMFIPQTFNYWDIKPNDGEDISTEPTDKAYITIEANAVAYVAKSTGDKTDPDNYTMGLDDFMDLASAFRNQKGTPGYDSDLPEINSPLCIKQADGSWTTPDGQTVIVDAEGAIKDVDNIIFRKAYEDNIIGTLTQFDVIVETYDPNSVSPANYFSNIHGYGTEGDADYAANPGYGKLYKPMCKTTVGYNEQGQLTSTYTPLVVEENKHYNLIVNLSFCVRNSDGDGPFGTASEAG